MNKIKSKGDTVFHIINFIIMAVLVIVCFYPLWYVLIGSFSSASAISMGDVTFWIKGFNVLSYKKAFSTPYLTSSYLNTVFYSFFGTFFSLFLTITGGYALSKKRLHGRRVIMFIITFTMWFGAGLIPNYLLYRSLHLLNTRWAVILHGAVSAFYLTIMRSAFEGVPDAFEESMKLDGASDFRIMLSMYIPMTVPTIMTLTLYYFVGRWNTYFWPMVVLSSETLVPLQVVLRKLIVEMNGLMDAGDSVDITTMSKDTVVYATMIIAIVPMLVLYPFIQKFFVKGVVVGGVKG